MSQSASIQRCELIEIICFRMSEDEDDPEEKVGPTIRYLQKLGPDHLTVIFESSRWVFEQDRKAALEVSSLTPRC